MLAALKHAGSEHQQPNTDRPISSCSQEGYNEIGFVHKYIYGSTERSVCTCLWSVTRQRALHVCIHSFEMRGCMCLQFVTATAELDGAAYVRAAPALHLVAFLVCVHLTCSWLTYTYACVCVCAPLVTCTLAICPMFSQASMNFNFNFCHHI